MLSIYYLDRFKIQGVGWGNEIKEDILRDLCERISFRQQIFLLVIDVRVTTPAKAKELGSDYIVVGRPITAAEDPVAAYRRCIEEFCD